MVPPGKKGLCKYFAENGRCAKGDNCDFHHDKSGSAPSAKAKPQAKAKAKAKAKGKAKTSGAAAIDVEEGGYTDDEDTILDEMLAEYEDEDEY